MKANRTGGVKKDSGLPAPRPGAFNVLVALLGRNGRPWMLLDARDRIKFVLLFALMVFGAGVELAALAAIQLYVALMAAGTTALPPLLTDALSYLPVEADTTVITSGMVAILLFKFAVFAAIYWAMAKVLAGMQIRLTSRLFRAYQYAPYSWHLANTSADLQRSLREDVGEVIGGMLQLLQFVLSVVTAIAICVFLVLALPGPILLGLSLSIGLFVAISAYSHRILVEAGQKWRLEGRNVIEAIQQGFGALTEARILGRRIWFQRAFRRAVTGVADAQRRRIFIQQTTPILVETVLLIAMMLMIVAILRLSSSLEVALQVTTALALAVFRLKQVLTKATSALNRISGSWPSFGAIVADLTTLEQVEASDPDDDDGPPLSFQDLRFDDVGFSFPGQDIPALDRITLAIARGERVAIAGATGSGKSTLMALMLGLLDPAGGRVTVNGRELPGGLRQWRRLIGYVPQTIYLIDATIAANVALGVDAGKIDRERVWEVLEMAGLAAHVKTLPQGIDTPVGEQGTWLSGGQRQRIGVARALYGQPDVLILDEATSALDRQTEKALLKSLKALPGDCTVITVSHKIDSVKAADRIILLAHGRLVAQGSYPELVAHSAEFRTVTQIEPQRSAE